MQSRRRFLGLALAGVVAAVGVAACGSDSKSSAGGATTTAGAGTTAAGGATTAGQPTTTARTEKVTLRLGYFPNITHATALVGVARGHLRQDKLGAERHARDQDVQRRHRGHPRRSFADAIDATYIGPNPAINAVPKSRRQGDPDRVRLDVGRRLPRREARDQHARPTSRARRGQPAARQHPGRRPAHVAEEPGPRDRHRRRRRRLDQARRTTPTRSTRSTTATSTAPGCPSRGPPAWSRRAGARCWSTRRPCGRSGKFVTTHLIVGHEVPRRAPRRRRDACSRVSSRPSTTSTGQPRRGPDRSPTRRSRSITSKPLTDAGRRRGVEEPRVHRRPDRLVAEDLGRQRQRRRPARSPST